MGLRDPAVDTLVEGLIQADSREELITHTRALDRVLRAKHILVPNYYTPVYRVAYWDKFDHPEITPKYGLALQTWWVDPQEADALEVETAVDEPAPVTTPVSPSDNQDREKTDTPDGASD